MIDILLRVGAFGLALFGLALFFGSLSRVSVLNRRSRDVIARGLERAMLHIIAFILKRKKGYGDVQKTMAWAMPIYLATLIATWFLIVQVSFTLLIWAVEAESGWLHAFISSGSSLSTLGFATPTSTTGQLLAILEGAFGLGIIVFIFTFIPGYSSAIQAREERVSWLYGRTGMRPTICSLVEWNHGAAEGNDMTPIWNDCERWFIDIRETHDMTPILALVPSIYPGRTWIGAAAAILDAASLSLSTLDVKGLASARVCYEAGVEALAKVARHFPPQAGSTAEADLRGAYDAAFDRLSAAGLPLKADRAECREEFVNLRSAYEGSIRQIAAAAFMPIDEPWVLPLGFTPSNPVGRP
jgi:hypothetical protein